MALTQYMPTIVREMMNENKMLIEKLDESSHKLLLSLIETLQNDYKGGNDQNSDNFTTLTMSDLDRQAAANEQNNNSTATNTFDLTSSNGTFSSQNVAQMIGGVNGNGNKVETNQGVGVDLSQNMM